MLRLEQFNGFTACINSTILMLNNIWNGLVNDVKATKKCYDKLETAMMTMNDHLNDGVSALDAKLDRLEDSFWTIRNVQEDVHITINKQQHQIFDMDKQISFYSRSIVQLEGKKAEEVKARFDVLEQCIAGQDDQIKVLLHHLTAMEEVCYCYQESSPKVISCCCFDVTMKLIGDVQETKDEPEAGGLEYEDEEVEAFRHSLIPRN